MDILRRASPNVYKELKKKAKEAGTYSLGRFGLNIFYCWNYIAPQHPDSDHSWTISIQTHKTGNGREYNFSYSDYGYYIHTEENCLWQVFLFPY
jgi:hypothetical protein